MLPAQPPVRIEKMMNGNGTDYMKSGSSSEIIASFKHTQIQGGSMGFVYDSIAYLLVHWRMLQSVFNANGEDPTLETVLENTIDL